ncbi:hypothetical protein MRX96_037538 [Rhipicephalus microplus]
MPNRARKFRTLHKFGKRRKKMCCAAQGVIAASAGYIGKAKRDRRPAVAAIQQPSKKAPFDCYNFYEWRHALRVSQIIATANEDLSERAQRILR